MHRRLRMNCIIAVLMALSLTPFGVVESASSGTNPAVDVPWEVKTVNTNVNATKISVGLGGANQYPLISYDTDGDNGELVFAIPAILYPGNCGVGNAWLCSTTPQSAADGLTSQMAVYNFQDSFKVSWVYQDFSFEYLRLLTREFRNSNLEDLGSTNLVFVNPSVFNDDDYKDWLIIGPPSIVFDEVGNLHAALIMGFGGTFQLVYAHRVSGTPTNPCNNDPVTHFQCDVIYRTPSSLSSDVHIVVTPSGEPRISFFNFADEGLKLMYAYPQSNPAYQPNCGPAIIKTWRCITIETSSPGNNFSAGAGDPPMLDMAIGPYAPHMIYKSRDTALNIHLSYATYVGRGGNCGEDYGLVLGGPPELMYRWNCSEFLWDNADAPYSSFSLKVDSLDYPVIALNRLSALAYHVGLIYPFRRIGRPETGWVYDYIDGKDIDTGKGVALVLGKANLGLIAYAELEDFDPNLKIAYQEGFKVYVAAVRK